MKLHITYKTLNGYELSVSARVEPPIPESRDLPYEPAKVTWIRYEYEGQIMTEDQLREELEMEDADFYLIEDKLFELI